MDTAHLNLALSAINVLVLPAMVGLGRYMVRLELRLARLEWAIQRSGHAPLES
ncbi:hypothetical protein [Methylibium sp. Root1272]|uniref:hypothetical protein n=1 Tax=Methylibium sp. Root1272 TaxID=1736441 RepID=UPI000A5227D4|nr:hypothetical protein [Methylibium sp. Root1272]